MPGAAMREGNIPWINHPQEYGAGSGSTHTAGSTHIAGSFHQRLLDGFETPPLPAAACTGHSPGTAPGAGFWGATISEGSGMEHRYLQGQSKEIAVCFSHLGKVERLCKSETRRSLAKPVVFWCCKRLNYTK